MYATLANGITTATNGTYVAVQPVGATQPVMVEIFGKALGTAGAFSITFDIETSGDGTTFTQVKEITIAGTAQSKPFALQHKVSAPFMRLNVTAISGTGAALSATVRV